MYVLILVLGLRQGELLGLGWDDLDLDAGTVTIGWQIQRVGKVRGIERRRTKTASSDATLPLPPICVVALRRHREAQEAAKAAAGDARHENGLVITTRFGTPTEPRNFLRFWDRRCGEAGLRHMEIYTQVTDQQPRDALKRLGESLGQWPTAALHCRTGQLRRGQPLTAETPSSRRDKSTPRRS